VNSEIGFHSLALFFNHLDRVCISLPAWRRRRRHWELLIHANVREKGLGFGLKDGPAEKR